MLGLETVALGPDEAYLKAAVLHNHYCGKRSVSWRETRLMFYEALIDLGVNSYKAKLMEKAQSDSAARVRPSSGSTRSGRLRTMTT